METTKILTAITQIFKIFSVEISQGKNVIDGVSIYIKDGFRFELSKLEPLQNLGYAVTFYYNSYNERFEINFRNHEE